MPPIKTTMTSINNVFEYYNGKFNIYDFNTNNEILTLDELEFLDLEEFLEHIKKMRKG